MEENVLSRNQKLNVESVADINSAVKRSPVGEVLCIDVCSSFHILFHVVEVIIKDSSMQYVRRSVPVEVLPRELKILVHIALLRILASSVSSSRGITTVILKDQTPWHNFRIMTFWNWCKFLCQ